MKKALITGVTGQDGSYLTELLLDKGYQVHGIKRRSSSFNTQRIDQFYIDPHEKTSNFFLHYGDMTDSTNLIRIVQEIQPDEIYNLAAQSHVKVSFDTPEYTANADGLGTLRLLEAIRILRMEDKVKFYQAGTSEMFGLVSEIPQKESTPFYPRSPYGVAKIYGYWITVNYREAYNIFACNGILFNHESPVRGETFVTRKITRAAARIKLGLQSKIYLGNLNSKRDWGHAKDYVEGMWLMLQQEKPEDYVLATGKTNTIRCFIELTFKEAGIEIEWEGSGINEKGIIKGITNSENDDKYHSNVDVGDIVIEIDPRYFRPTEVDILVGDATKARNMLGWKPKYGLEDLISEMYRRDFIEAQREVFLEEKGYKVEIFFE